MARYWQMQHLHFHRTGGGRFDQMTIKSSLQNTISDITLSVAAENVNRTADDGAAAAGFAGKIDGPLALNAESSGTIKLELLQFYPLCSCAHGRFRAKKPRAGDAAAAPPSERLRLKGKCWQRLKLHPSV
jgi:hypothetical protein